MTGERLVCDICGANATSWGIGYEQARCDAHKFDGLFPLPDFPSPLPPEIREILRDVAAGVTGPDLRGRAAAAIVARGLCPRCADTGQELLDTGGAPGVAWGTCHGCAAPSQETPRPDGALTEWSAAQYAPAAAPAPSAAPDTRCPTCGGPGGYVEVDGLSVPRCCASPGAGGADAKEAKP
jgi:hypothetical protein